MIDNFGTYTHKLQWNRGNIPVNLISPVISGNAWQGETLTTTNGTWTGDAPITYSYKWQRDAVDIPLETNSTYTTTFADIGKTITCKITATNAAGSTSVSSNGIEVYYKNTTALHEWSYQNATNVGTTVTMVDTGSVGGLNMTNPDAASEPTLQLDGVYFDGVSEYVENPVVDFRVADTLGVIHTYFYYDGNITIVFSGYQDANNYIIVNVIMGGFPQFLVRIAGANYILRGSTALNIGWNCLSAAQDDLVARLFINGVKETSYSIDTTAGSWFNLINTVSLDFSFLPPTGFRETLIKYIAYCPYIDDATVISEQNKILNSSL